MKAMILAAGLGTRLRPLSLRRPKALMPVGNQPVINRVIDYLKTQNVSQIVVNAHHMHGKIVDYLDKGRPFGIQIDVRVEPRILGTGGGIKNTQDFWDEEPFVVINGDVLTDIELAPAINAHKRSSALATLILHDCEPFNQVMMDEHNYITDIAPKRVKGRLAFTGIHILDPVMLDYISSGVFSNIIDCYLDLIRSGLGVMGYVADGHYWRDMGTLDNYILANKEAVKGQSLISEDCSIHPSVHVSDWAVIGQGAVLEREVEIKRSILWEGVKVRNRVKIIDSIVTSSRSVEYNLYNEIF